MPQNSIKFPFFVRNHLKKGTKSYCCVIKTKKTWCQPRNYIHSFSKHGVHPSNGDPQLVDSIQSKDSNQLSVGCPWKKGKSLVSLTQQEFNNHFLNWIPFFHLRKKKIFCYLKQCAYVLSRLSCDRLFATPWTGARQAPLPMGFSRQEYWSELPCPPLGNLPDPGIEHESLTSSALAGGVLPLATTWEAHIKHTVHLTTVHLTWAKHCARFWRYWENKSALMLTF